MHSLKEKTLSYYHKIKNNNKLLSLAVLLALVLTIPTILSVTQKVLDIRQHADSYAATITVNPTSAKVGDTLTVNWSLQQTTAATPTPPVTQPTTSISAATPTPAVQATNTILVNAAPHSVGNGRPVTFSWDYRDITPDAHDYFKIVSSDQSYTEYMYLNSCAQTPGASAPSATGHCSLNTIYYKPTSYTVTTFQGNNPLHPLTQDTFMITILFQLTVNSPSLIQGDSLDISWNYQGGTADGTDYIETFTATGADIQVINLVTCSNLNQIPTNTGHCTLNTTNYPPATYTIKAFKLGDRTHPLNQISFTVTPPPSTPQTAPQNPKILSESCTHRDQWAGKIHDIYIGWTDIPETVTGYEVYVYVGLASTYGQANDTAYREVDVRKANSTSATYVQYQPSFGDEQSWANAGADTLYFKVRAYNQLPNGLAEGPFSSEIPLIFCQNNPSANPHGGGNGGGGGARALFSPYNHFGLNFPSFTLVQKAYAQATTLTGAETLKLINTTTNTPVGNPLYLTCADASTGTPPPATAIMSGQCTMTIPTTATAGSYVITMYASDGTTVLGSSPTLTVSQAQTQATKSPIYRLLRTDINAFHWSTGPEREQIIAQKYNGKVIWDQTPVVAWYAYTTPQTGTVPIYRLVRIDGSSFYWATASEKDAILAQTYNGHQVWQQNPVIAWYAYTTPQPGTVAVYRLYRPDLGIFYWATASEKDAILAETYNGKQVWQQTPTIAWYAFTSAQDVPTLTPTVTSTHSGSSQ